MADAELPTAVIVSSLKIWVPVARFSSLGNHLSFIDNCVAGSHGLFLGYVYGMGRTSRLIEGAEIRMLFLRNTPA